MSRREDPYFPVSNDHQNRRQATMDPSWAPGLGSIPDGHVAYPDGDARPHSNSYEYSQGNAYDPTAVLDSFNAMTLHDPITRGTSAMSHTSDPIPRAGTSQSGYSGNRAHVSGFPVSPNQRITNTDSTDYLNYFASQEGDARGPYSEMDRARGQTAKGYGYPDPHQPPFPPPQVYHQSEYNNTLYAAASDVLGMAPPQGPSANQYPAHTPNYQQQLSYSDHSPPPLSSASSMPYSMGPEQPQYQQGPYARTSDGASIMPPSLPPTDGLDDDIEMRPRGSRTDAAASVNPRTQKSKAIDLSAPPYTKEYIDQYRTRIKDDPDVEAHFLYAKYLIDAAKKIGANAKDQRSVKKYRDLLITESLKVMRRLATQGEAYDEAQFFLANCYGTGTLGLQVDHERAYHLYLQAAKQNHAAASYRVAVCNEIGAGTKREPERAAAFYRKAASLGDTAAMYKLGVILLNGSLGEQRNSREAVGWLQRAAEQADEENPHALHELGLLYANPQSQIVPHDPAYARELFTRAGHFGYTHAQFKLGQCYEYGTLTCPVDPRRSIAWYTKAAERGHPEAELALSGWYLTGSEGVLKQSDSEAYLWARRAGNRGLSKAEYAVGYYAEVGIGVKQDMEFAKRWYMRAAAQGNKRAMERLLEMKRAGNKRMKMGRPTRQQAKDECVIS